MVKFAKRFFYQVIPEWKDQYIDYRALYRQIKAVKASVLDLAKAYAHIKEITGDEGNKAIQLERMKAEKEFWEMLDANVEKVERWYISQMEHFTEQFHILTLQAIQLQLIEEYIPFTRGLSTRLERELGRLHLPLDIELSTIQKKDEAKRPLVRENPLFPLSKKTSISEVIKRMRKRARIRRGFGKEGSSLKSNTSSENDSDGLGGDSGYDSDKSISVGNGSSDNSDDEARSKIDTIDDDNKSIGEQSQRSQSNTVSSSQRFPSRNLSSHPNNQNNSPNTNISSQTPSGNTTLEPEERKSRKSTHSERGRVSKEHHPRPYQVLQLRNLTKEDIESTDMSKAAFTVHHELTEIGKVDRRRAILKLRHAFSEFYRGLCLLQNYVTLNVEAIEKILAKHDKNIELGTRDRYIQEKVSKYSFYKRTALTTLMRETEHVYAQCFTSGHRTAAMKKLRVPQAERTNGASLFRFGLLLGVSVAFLCVIIYLAALTSPFIALRMRPVLIIYRMMALAVLMLWGWGVDMYIWTKYRVNYVFIFEFDPRRHTRAESIFAAAALFTVILIVSLLLFLWSSNPQPIPGFVWLQSIPKVVHPLVVFVFFTVCLIWFQFKSRWWLLKMVASVIASPFTPVRFPQFFLGDQLVSITMILYDFEYFICYLVNDAWTGTDVCDNNYKWILPILAVLPPLWRFFQCLRRYVDMAEIRQLLNAGKYSTSFFVTFFSFMRGKYPDTVAWTVLWLLAIVVGTCYTYIWDVKMDWSLADFKQKKHWALRQTLLYPTYWYYFAIVSDLIMRSMWTLTISPESITKLIHPDLFASLLATVEVYRRCLWNVFRVENEQINNIGKFRAIKDMPLPLPVKNPFEDEEEPPV